MRWADYLYRKAGRSLVGGALSYYPDLEPKAAERTHSRPVGEKKKFSLSSWAEKVGGGFKRSLKQIKNFFSRQTEQSIGVRAVRKLSDGLLYMPLRSLGVAACTSGMLILLIALLRFFIWAPGSAIAIDYVITGVVLVAIAMPMLVSGLTLAQALVSSRTMHFVLFRLLGVRRSSIQTDIPLRQQQYLPFFVGIAVGVFSYFASPLLLFAALAAILVLYRILRVPESGVVLIFFCLPFLPTMAVAAMNIYVAFCYFLKWIRGKRLLKFEKLDIVILLYAAIVLFGGFFSVTRASLKPALLYVSFIAGYFVVVNTIRTSEWVGRCVASLITAAAAVGLLGLWENFTGQVATTWQDEDMFGDISGSVVSTFGNPNVLGEYLIMTLPFAVALLFMASKMGGRVLGLVLCGIGGCCLIYTWSRGAWLGFMIAMLLFLLVYTRKTVLLIFAGIAALPFVPLILPASILGRLTSIGNIADSSTSYRVYIWRAAVDMIRDFFFTGIGVGNEAFNTVYQEYTFSGIESAPHSHNLFLQITIETGIFGLLAFLLVILLFVQSCFAYFGSDYVRLRKTGRSVGQTVSVWWEINRSRIRDKLYVIAGLTGIVGMLAQGMTDYVFYNYRVFFMFWLLMGLTQAARRAAVRAAAPPEKGVALDIYYR